MKKLFLVFILVLCISGVLNAGPADAVHVAATTTNTAAYNGTVPWYGSVDDPTLWKLRTDITGDWGNDPFTAGDTSVAYGDHLLLETTLTLDPGTTYDIYVDYTVNISTTYNNWLINGGLNPASLIGYDRDGANVAGIQYTAGYDLGVSPENTNRGLRRGYLGQATANASTGEIKVYILDGPGVSSTFNRTWYAGIAYEAAAEIPPQPASNPQPIDTATGVYFFPEVSLSWTAGIGSESHDVYFGNDYNGVLNADTGSTEYYKGNRTDATFTTESLSESTPYYWRIDEVNQYGTTPGSVWSFTTDDDCGSWGYSQMDFNTDCRVDLIDFSYLSAVWLDLYMASDLNYDGSADTLDFGLFTSDWLVCSFVNSPGCRNYSPTVPIVKLPDVTYKNTVDVNADPVDLKMYHRWQPETMTEPLPAVVLFYGGGWVNENIEQFEEYCKALAARGMICMAPDYRNQSMDGTTPYEAVTDAKSAVRWVRTNAASLNIDPNRIIVGGGSAGGHLAACAEIITGYEEPGEDLSVSSRANLLYLLNPIVDTTPDGYGSGKFTPETWEELSPVHHIGPGVCPTIIFHGTADTTVPFENVERFTQIMHDNGNICKLVPFEGRTHGFFNHISIKPENNPDDFVTCVEEGFKFFVLSDFIDGL